MEGMGLRPPESSYPPRHETYGMHMHVAFRGGDRNTTTALYTPELILKDPKRQLVVILQDPGFFLGQPITIHKCTIFGGVGHCQRRGHILLATTENGYK